MPVPDGLLNAAIALSGTPSQPRGTLDVSLRNIAFPESDMPPPPWISTARSSLPPLSSM